VANEGSSLETVTLILSFHPSDEGSDIVHSEEQPVNTELSRVEIRDPLECQKREIRAIPETIAANGYNC
jgi:hypothetical protein